MMVADTDAGGELLRCMGRPWDDLGRRCEDGSRDFTKDVDSSAAVDDEDDQTASSKAGAGKPKRAVFLRLDENVRSAPSGSPPSAKRLGAVPPSLSRDEGEDTAAPSAAASQHDVLGRFSPASLSKFRTAWCTKRYDHDASTCRSAHVDINGGWLRRDPSTTDGSSPNNRYNPEMCPNVVKLSSRGGAEPGGLVGVTINSCPNGMKCDRAHSWEEVSYHPLMYKQSRCEQALPPPSRGPVSRGVPRCPLGDVCPDLHPRGMFPRGSVESAASKDQQHSPPLKSADRPRSGSDVSGGGKGPSSRSTPHHRAQLDVSPPLPLCVHPSPSSEFDQYLILPGMRELFKRQSAVWAAFQEGGEAKMEYSPFSDDWGLHRRGTSDDGTLGSWSRPSAPENNPPDGTGLLLVVTQVETTE